MTIQFRVDTAKAIEVIVYIAKKCDDLWRGMKILYFADHKHLSKYGSTICGDKYIAMKQGAVPSHIYDIIKFVRGDGMYIIAYPAKDAFKVESWYHIFPKREPNLDYLSESNIECLDEAIEEIMRLPDEELERRTHEEDSAYMSANKNDSIYIEKIINKLPNSKEVLSYLNP